MTLFDRLCEQLDNIEIIDTHEHLSPFEPSFEKPAEYKESGIPGESTGVYVYNDETDFFREIFYGGYLPECINSSGIPFDYSRYPNLVERWRAFEPVWDKIQYTGYGQIVSIAVKDLFGIDKITVDNIELLNQKYLDSIQPGYYRKYLKDYAKIKLSILDSDLCHDKEFFRSVFRLDSFIMPVLQEHLYPIEQFSGVKIRSFDDWLDACEASLDKAISLGAVGIKCGLAYKRTLRFERTSYHDAEKAFNEMYKMRYIPGWEPQSVGADKCFEDYMMHYVCRLAEKRGIPMQIHTGIMVAGGNYLNHANPEHLSNLCIEYPGLKFDIFHIGYPYQQVLTAMAHMFRNVYIDMCWSHMFSPVASIEALSEMLEIVPYNKILAFGGDLGGGCVHSIYAHAKLARRNVAKVLARKIEAGLFDEARAIEISKSLFYDNAKELFRFE